MPVAMHRGLPLVCFGLGGSRELGRGPSLPCEHHAKEWQRLLQRCFGFVPGPGAWAEFFFQPLQGRRWQ